MSASASTSLVGSPGSRGGWGAGGWEGGLAWLVGLPGARLLCQACLGPECPLLTLGSPQEGPVHAHFPMGGRGQGKPNELGALGPCAGAAAGTTHAHPDAPGECGAGTTRLGSVLGSRLIFDTLQAD